MGRLREAVSLKNRTTRSVLLAGGAFIVGFVVLFVISIAVWEYSNSASFCTNVCHDVHPEEQIAYEDSYHANVGCTECHLSRGGMLENLPLKAGHLQHLPSTILGQYGRPVEWGALGPASESCERCHWPPAFQGDVVREIRRFLPDEDNTEKRTFLVLKVGGGEKDKLDTGMGYGIHWHALNTVEYIYTDEHRQDIPWMRATLPGGRIVEFNDVTNPLSAEEIAEAEKRVMDCVDCHNRVGHPFPPPERVIDEALAQGQLSRDLPFVKKEMLALLAPSYPSQEEALAAVESWEAEYKATYPDAAASHAIEIEQAAEVAKELVTRLVFGKPGITWRSFIDENGHKEFPGCFRCHDGEHLSPEGEPVRLHCNICHSIPVTVDPGGDPPAVPAASLQEPESHLEANFMADHRFQASDDCIECHGEITFGDDDSSFCALSACHGQTWPSVDLNAAFPHPVPLEGEHAEAWCHDCHEGVRRPEYVCSNCHQPPENHLEGTCDTCHAPQGWSESATSVVAQAPQVTHDVDGREDCLLCHDPAGQIKPAPANHESFVKEQCSLCHKVAP